MQTSQMHAATCQHVPAVPCSNDTTLCLQGIDAFDASRELDSLPEPAPAAGASIHAWRLIEVIAQSADSASDRTGR